MSSTGISTFVSQPRTFALIAMLALSLAPAILPAQAHLRSNLTKIKDLVASTSTADRMAAIELLRKESLLDWEIVNEFDVLLYDPDKKVSSHAGEVLGESMHKLGASPKVSDRLQATKLIIVLEGTCVSGPSTPKLSDLFWNLVNDPDKEVASQAAEAMSYAQETFNLPLEVAQKFAKFLETSISEDHFETLYRTYPLPEDDLQLYGCRVFLLNTLYQTYPLISARAYSDWQRSVPGALIRVFGSQRDQLSTRADSTVLEILGIVNDPREALTDLNVLLDSIEELTPERLEVTLSTLWKHRLFGDSMPMHSSLVVGLLPHLEKLLKKQPAKQGKDIYPESRSVLNALSKEIEFFRKPLTTKP